jgi:hypothetical protein
MRLETKPDFSMFGMGNNKELSKAASKAIQFVGSLCFLIKSPKIGVFNILSVDKFVRLENLRIFAALFRIGNS